MSAGRKTLDIDFLTLRKVRPLVPSTNRAPNANYILSVNEAGEGVWVNTISNIYAYGVPIGGGTTGATGPTGPAGGGGGGDTGPTGPQGPTGTQGLIGVNGVRGPTGPTGAQGSIGVNGISGPTGPTGAQGSTGAHGIMGPAGLVGVQGPTGVGGASGPAGPTGADGITGPAGPTGADGIIGPTGLVGVDGTIGPEGSTGASQSSGIILGSRNAMPLSGPSTNYILQLTGFNPAKSYLVFYTVRLDLQQAPITVSTAIITITINNNGGSSTVPVQSYSITRGNLTTTFTFPITFGITGQSFATITFNSTSSIGTINLTLSGLNAATYQYIEF